MAALMSSTPTKILRGLYQTTIQRAPSIETAIDGVSTMVTQSLSLGSENQLTQADIDDFEAWYLEQFGETVRASKEGNSAAITKGLKSFARRVSSIFK